MIINRNIHKIILIFLCLLLVSGCANASTISKDIEINLSPWYDYSEKEKTIVNYGSVTESAPTYFYYPVDANSRKLNVALSWDKEQDNNELSLTIINPNNVPIGTFNDNYDGIENGIIPVELSFQIPIPGRWTFQVRGVDVVTEQDFQIYIHDE